MKVKLVCAPCSIDRPRCMVSLELAGCVCYREVKGRWKTSSRNTRSKSGEPPA